MNRKKRNSHFGTDRISNLPCDVIHEILKHLPLHKAVRTSILSRAWRSKWLTLPYLVFDEKFEMRLHENYNFESVMYQVLAVHKGPVLKFTYEDYGVINIHPLLHFLSHHHVEELTLLLPDRLIPYRLFTFDHLKNLKLVNGTLKTPSSFKGFGRLVRLDLNGLSIEPGELLRLISKCPMLEHLRVQRCNFFTSLGNFEIDAPNLKSFCLDTRFKPTSICFKNTSIIEEVSISFYHCYSPEQSQGSQSNLIEFFGPLSSIKELKLKGGFLEFLARRGVPHELPENLSKLKVLQMSDIEFEKTDEVDCALCLIRSSPNVQNLEIVFRGEGNMLQEQSLGCKSYFIEFIGPLSSIKKLNLKCDFLEVLAGGDIPQELPNELGHLTVLQLSSINFVCIAEVGCVFCLIRSSPNLQSLEINLRNTLNGDVKPAVQFLKEQKKLKLTLSHLENVKIDCFSGLAPEKEFVKLLLSSATSLTKLELQLSYTRRRAPKKESKLLDQLTRFPRASSKVEITLL